MSELLKPCPFCGAAPSVYKVEIESGVFCTNSECNINVDTICTKDNIESQIETWNTRYYDNPMPACGHPARYAYTADEGTSYCVMCELEAAKIRIQEFIDEDLPGDDN
jgi:hypothetical protein